MTDPQTCTYLNTLLLSLLGSTSLVERWWESPNRAFGLELPKDQNYWVVKQYLEGHCFR